MICISFLGGGLGLATELGLSHGISADFGARTGLATGLGVRLGIGFQKALLLKLRSYYFFFHYVLS